MKTKAKKPAAKKATNTGWALTPVNWEYNDETYYRAGLEAPIQIFLTKAKADAAFVEAEKLAFIEWFGGDEAYVGLGSFREDVFRRSEDSTRAVLTKIRAKDFEGDNLYYAVKLPEDLTDDEFVQLRTILDKSISFYTLTEVSLDD